jgi:L-fuconolactonase
MRIDAHQHFWRYTPDAFPWIDERMGVLKRDFLPRDLQPILQEAGIDGTIAVEARPTVAETDWLLSLAAMHPFIRGVVGWLPLASPEVDAHLERYSTNVLLKGVRHALQGEPDGYMSGPAFNRGIGALERHGLTYDVLVYERQLPEVLNLVDRHPRQTFVIDHLAKPNMRDRRRARWTELMRHLALREHCYCKVSGLVTEAVWDQWTDEQLTPYWETVLGAYGPERLLFGSDWPVALLATTYERWSSIAESFTAILSSDERALVLGGTASEIYRL